jgi:hypothetical protein
VDGSADGSDESVDELVDALVEVLVVSLSVVCFSKSAKVSPSPWSSLDSIEKRITMSVKKPINFSIACCLFVILDKSKLNFFISTKSFLNLKECLKEVDKVYIPIQMRHFFLCNHLQILVGNHSTCCFTLRLIFLGISLLENRVEYVAQHPFTSQYSRHQLKCALNRQCL